MCALWSLPPAECTIVLEVTYVHMAIITSTDSEVQLLNEYHGSDTDLIELLFNCSKTLVGNIAPNSTKLMQTFNFGIPSGSHSNCYINNFGEVWSLQPFVVYLRLFSIDAAITT